MEVSKQIETKLSANMNLTKKQIMLGNFLGGLSWGVGSVIGATVVVALLVWILSLVNPIPVIGDFTSQMMQNINQKATDSKEN